MDVLRKGLAIFVWLNTAFFALIIPFAIWDAFSGEAGVVADIIIIALCVGLAYFSYRLGLWIYPRTKKVRVEAVDNQKNKQPENVNADSILFTLKEMAELILADDVVHQGEAEQLLAYLEKHSIATLGPAARELYQALTFALDDGHLDDAEAADVKALLSEICDRPQTKIAPTIPAEKPKTTPAPQPKPLGTTRDKLSLPPLSSGTLLGFSYEDSTGNLSDRIVEFRSISKSNGLTYLKSICTDRRAPRTFRTDRMMSVFSLETGELIDDLDAYLTSTKPPVTKSKFARPKQSSTDSATKVKKPEIFFTGLWQEDRQYYESMAPLCGFKVVKSMTKNLTYLCCGVNAGPKKIEEAEARGIAIMDISELDTMINNVTAKLDELNEADEQRA